MARYGAPVDEVALARQVAPSVAALEGEIPDRSALAHVAAERGLDYATMLFYRAILDSPYHGAFARALDAIPAAPPESAEPLEPIRPHGGRVLIVPAYFYRERPELGGDGRLAAEIARACGFDAEVVPVASRGGVVDNARRIARAVREAGEGPLWILSLSKGGAEVRVALTEGAGGDEGVEGIGAPVLDRVAGWVNVNGTVRGSHFLDELGSTPAGRLRLRALLLALRIPYAHAAELRTDHPLWRRPLPDLSRIEVVNVIGVPLLSHLPRQTIGRYRRLGRLGPNDGFVLLPELLLPGKVYPVWGADHLFRSPQVSPLLYRLFRWIAERNGGGC